MFLYTSIEAVIAVITGILLAVCTKRDSSVIYNKLDKAGRITNILLIPVYICLSPLYLGLGLFSYTTHEGLLGILGWIVAIIIASAALFCGLGLGLSVAFRKKGKSKLSFAVQFAGFAGIALSLLLFFIFYGNLLSSIN